MRSPLGLSLLVVSLVWMIFPVGAQVLGSPRAALADGVAHIQLVLVQDAAGGGGSGGGGSGGSGGSGTGSSGEPKNLRLDPVVGATQDLRAAADGVEKRLLLAENAGGGNDGGPGTGTPGSTEHPVDPNNMGSLPAAKMEPMTGTPNSMDAPPPMDGDGNSGSSNNDTNNNSGNEGATGGGTGGSTR